MNGYIGAGLLVAHRTAGVGGRSPVRLDTDDGRSAAFLEIAEGLGLGVAAREKIQIADVKLG